jgi:hypothetical protein
MRLVQPLGALPEYYDRYAVNQTIQYLGNNVQPHNITLRAQYEVPTGRKAIIDSMFLLITTGNVANSYGRRRMTVYYIPSGGTAIPIAMLQNESNSHRHTECQTFTGLGVLLGGDKIEVYTEDASIGGDCYYWYCAKIFEFE